VRDVHASEAQRRIHAQQALGRALGFRQQLVEVFDVAEDAARALEQNLTLGRHAHAARGSIDQRNAKARFHLTEPLAHGRGGDAHVACGRTEAAAAGEGRIEAELRGLDAAFHARSIVNARLTMP
jgi:hypothetical protein